MDSEQKRIDNLGDYAGNSPGRTKGSVGGRELCLRMMDAMLAEAGNIKALREEWQTEFDKAPALFWLKYVVAVLPKKSELDVGEATLRTLKIINESNGNGKLEADH